VPAAKSRLLLASTSVYRAELLHKLRLTFDCIAPQITEDVCVGESPSDRALRLAQAKAAAVAVQAAGATVIGSDQVAACAGELLHKPGSQMQQRAHLLRASGQTLSFHTAVCVIDAAGAAHCHLDHTVCQLRQLTADDVDRYVAAEPALDCAGGFRIEALGITLFDQVRSDDPSALIGLPLIAVSRILRTCGWRLP